MTKKPILNALAAFAYVAGVASFLFTVPQYAVEKEDTIFIPIAMLSLFVLSAAVMAYVFLAEPILTYVRGEHEKAVKLFLGTVGYFALLTVCAFITMMLW